jgi:hypothetical protein
MTRSMEEAQQSKAGYLSLAEHLFSGQGSKTETSRGAGHTRQACNRKEDVSGEK